METHGADCYKSGEGLTKKRRLRIDSKKINDHQQNMYVVFKVQTLIKYLSNPP